MNHTCGCSRHFPSLWYHARHAKGRIADWATQDAKPSAVPHCAHTAESGTLMQKQTCLGERSLAQAAMASPSTRDWSLPKGCGVSRSSASKLRRCCDSWQHKKDTRQATTDPRAELQLKRAVMSSALSIPANSSTASAGNPQLFAARSADNKDISNKGSKIRCGTITAKLEPQQR